MNRFVKTITWPVRDLGKSIARGFTAPGRREVWGAISALPRRARSIRENRDPAAPDAPDLEEFGAVLNHWGITPAQLPVVIRNLTIEACLFGILGIYGIYIAVSGGSWWHWSQGLVATVAGGTVVILRSWRISVLKNGRFVPFYQWLTGGGY